MNFLNNLIITPNYTGVSENNLQLELLAQSMLASKILSQPFDDSKSQARPNQTFIICKFSKNILLLILESLNINKILAFVLSSKQLFSKLSEDPFFHKIAASAF